MNHSVVRSSFTRTHMSGQISITGLDKVKLLEYLWRAQNKASFFALFPQSAPDFDKELAKTAVTTYIDYFQGRAIKADLSGDSVDPWLYDRDAGAGRFQQIVKCFQ